MQQIIGLLSSLLISLGSAAPSAQRNRNTALASTQFEQELVNTFYTFRNRIGHVTKIGSGSYGAVYSTQVQCQEKESHVAIKVQNFKTNSRKRNFEQEARVMRQFHSPYFIQYFGEARMLNQDTNHGSHAILMEKAYGGDLASAMKKDSSWSRIPSITLARLTVELLQGVAEMHQQEYLHGDLKAGNILLTQPCTGFENLCQIRIADMGFACKPVLSENEKGSSYITCEGVAGTPTHMAPELDVINTASKADKAKFWRQDVQTILKQDVFSAGIVVYAVLFGRLPRYIRKAKTLPTLIAKKVEFCNKIESLMKQHNMPPIVTNMMVGMLQQNPSKRITIAESLDLAVQWLHEVGGTEITNPVVPTMPSCWQVCFEFLHYCSDRCVVDPDGAKPAICSGGAPPDRSPYTIFERFHALNAPLGDEATNPPAPPNTELDSPVRALPLSEDADDADNKEDESVDPQVAAALHSSHDEGRFDFLSTPTVASEAQVRQHVDNDGMRSNDHKALVVVPGIVLPGTQDAADNYVPDINVDTIQNWAHFP